MFTRIQLPDGNGLEFLPFLTEQYPKMPIAIITAYGNMDSAITALKQGV